MKGKVDTKPRKLPKQGRSREMVEIILTATARVLVREGYDSATTNRISEVAGVSVGSLYQYFPNKESLLATLAERHLEDMEAIFDKKFETIAGLDPQSAVQSLVEAAVQAHAVAPELHKALVEQVPQIGRFQKIREVENKIEEGLYEYLKNNQEKLATGDARLAAFLIFRTVESATHAAVLDRPDLLENGRLIEELTTLVLGYVSHD